MRDKGEKEFMHKEFADFAWSEMEKVLDREMPVDKKKKRGAIWFWARAAGVLLILSIALFIQQQIKTKTLAANVLPNTQTINATADTKSSNSIENKRPTTDIASIDKAQHVKNQTIPYIPKHQSNDTYSPKTTTDSDVSTKSTISTNAPKTEENVAFQSTDNQEISTQKIAIENPKPQQIQTNNVVQKTPLVHPIATQINSIQPTTLTFNAVQPFLPLKAVPLSKKNIPRKVNITAFAKAQTASFVEVSGYEAGILLSKNIKNTKWSTNAGLAYQTEIRQLRLEQKSTGQYILDTEIQNVPIGSSIDGTVFFDIDASKIPDLDESSSSQAIRTSVANVLNLQLQYVSLPIQIDYKLSPRFSMLAGLSPSLFIKGRIVDKQDYLKVSNRETSDVNTLEAFGNALNSNYIPLQTNALKLTSKILAPVVINRFRLPAYLGVKYQVSRHFGLSLDVEANLLPIVNKDFVRIDNGRFRLGGYWRF